MVADGEEISYRDLAGLVETMGRRLGEGRRLVLLHGANTLDAVVTYLAALSVGHPVLLVAPSRPDVLASMVAAYDPDVVVGPGQDGWIVDHRRTGSAHELHPDLALLMSTSGSTGSPKLVRLSRQNLQANALAISQSLSITTADRAATTLPLHYCYGLSVLNSHLLSGAGVILTDLSVVDECFWTLLKEHRATSFAGVPFTFDLLDRVGFAQLRLPELRYVTVAGGRMRTEQVRRYSDVGREAGWDLILMYGQTEATARMAYLPPQQVQSHPDTVGIAIPGGSFSLEATPEASEPGTGELVYRGPNVMMGYASSPVDLALGATLDRLRTGDIARRTSDGSFHIVGRRSRFAKVFGLRLDLGRIEDQLAADGLAACCVEAQDGLVVAVEAGGDVEALRKRTAASCGLPVSALHLRPVSSLPRLANGKPDYGAVRELGRRPRHSTAARTGSDQGSARTASARPPTGVVDAAPAGSTAALVSLFAELLGCPAATADSTFVSLGGDSLSYVEMSVRLEEELGGLPGGWHLMRIGALAAARLDPTDPARRRRGRAVETSVVLRAAAIILVVGSHIGVFSILGGAHVLLTVAGFNFARFHLTDVPRAQRMRRSLRSISRIVVPTVVFVALTQAVAGTFRLRELLLFDSLLRPSSAGYFWFVEVLVYLLLAVTALVAVPAVHRWERRWPFGVPVVLVLVFLLTRYQVIGSTSEAMRIYTAPVIFWLFALGWSGAKARTPAQRAAVSVLAMATVPGFFADPARDALVMAAILLLVWVPTLRVSTGMARPLGALSSASLYIYLSHWHVYPYLRDQSQVLALIASLAAGLGYWWVFTGAPRHVRGLNRAPGRSPAFWLIKRVTYGAHETAVWGAPTR